MSFAVVWLGVLGVLGGLHQILMRRRDTSDWEIAAAHTLFWCAVAVFVVRAFLLAPFVTSGPSMSPTLPSGSLVWVDENAYGFTWPLLGLSSIHEAPPRGNVVAFTAPTGKVWIKRVRARPGDKVRFVPSVGWFIDGAYVAATSPGSAGTWEHWPGRRHRPVAVVPPNRVFLIGDNTLNSTDGRDFGLTPVPNLIGRVIWPHLSQPPSPPPPNTILPSSALAAR